MDWQNCESFYYHNQLDADERKVWDELYDMCNYYLNTENNYSKKSDSGIEYGMTDRVDISGYDFTTDELKKLSYLFQFANPQFFFFSNSWMSSTNSTAKTITFTCPASRVCLRMPSKFVR